ncbi:unnamed protein product [Brassicogethes aeneus]|uniref:cyclin-dependent kinase n=1 Tax=Brassicogethes aeneus TaxID=1431903 RepID=A0A9P0FFN1_BRAAE|nr:unnamed protein product [Brassicogethes aeneus]
MADRSSHFSAPDQTGHEYESLSRIGSGAYGTVYKAKDKRTNRVVALKKVCVALTEDGIPMNTLREIGLLKQLNAHEHPNIVRLLDICYGHRTGKELIMYLVFEHVEQDLGSYIERNPRGFNTIQIKNLSREILNGVDFLHSNRIVHRDLKPQNLLVTFDGHIKLADFGLAKTYDFDMKLTSVVVTLWYRAPEVLLGLPYATPVDVWSIGCIIVELYNLTPLFCGTSEGDQLTTIFRELGRPSETDWPKDNISIKWESFRSIDSTGYMHNFSGNICETAKDLIMRMLTFDPIKRISAMEALNHTYFTEEPINT